MRNNTVGIYKITSPTGSVYIGQSSDIVKRWRYYSSVYSKSSQPRLFNSFRKYGVSAHSFEIVHELPVDVSRDVLNSYEVFYISLYKNTGVKMLNIKGGGSHGAHSAETKEKMSRARKGRAQSPETVEKRVQQMRGKKRKPMREEHRKRLSELMVGRKHENDTRIKMSISQKAAWLRTPERGHNEKTKLLLSLKMGGKKLSDETKKLISNATKERWHDAEYKKCVGNSISKGWARRRAEVFRKTYWKSYIIENGSKHTAGELAAKFPNINKRSIVGFCHKNNIRYIKIINQQLKFEK